MLTTILIWKVPNDIVEILILVNFYFTKQASYCRKIICFVHSDSHEGDCLKVNTIHSSHVSNLECIDYYNTFIEE